MPSGVSAAASAPAWARPRVAATRARSPARAVSTRWASRAARSLRELELLGADEVDLLTLKQAGLVGQLIKVVKVIKCGELTRKITLKGIAATAGAKAAIEAAGGAVVDAA